MNKEITFEIVEHYGTFEQSESGWTKEVNLVSWNGADPKLDIRSWSPDHTRSAKVGTMTLEAAAELGWILRQLEGRR